MRFIAALLLGTCALAGGTEAKAGKPTFLLGIGYSGSTANDVERDGKANITFDGATVVGRLGLRPRWGIHAAYSHLADSERFPSGAEISLEVVHLDGYLAFRPEYEFRPYVKVGLMWMDFETEHPGGATVASDAVAPSCGLGFEWGSPRFGMMFDVGFAPVRVRFDEDVEERFVLGNTALGFYFRFGGGRAASPSPDGD